MENLDDVIKEIRENGYNQELIDNYITAKDLWESFQIGIKNMINFPIFIDVLLMPLLGLGVFVVYKRSKRKKRKFHAPPTHQLPS